MQLSEHLKGFNILGIPLPFKSHYLVLVTEANSQYNADGASFPNPCCHSECPPCKGLLHPGLAQLCHTVDTHMCHTWISGSHAPLSRAVSHIPGAVLAVQNTNTSPCTTLLNTDAALARALLSRAASPSSPWAPVSYRGIPVLLH